MADREIDPRHANQVTGVLIAIAVVLDVLFFFLSKAYFDDRAATQGVVTETHLRGVRVAFGVFTAVVAFGGILAIRFPRLTGHVLAGAAALMALAGGVAAIEKELHPVLSSALLLCGTLIVVLTWRSLEKSRPAWAFLIAMCGTLGVVMLFGATKIRGTVGVGLWFAMIIPGLLGVATVALAMIRDEYREPT